MTETAEMSTAQELSGMPGPWRLERVQVGTEDVVRFGSRVLFRFATGDRGMRNLAMVALTQAGEDVPLAVELGDGLHC